MFGFELEATRRSGPRGHAHPAPRHGGNPGLHAGRHPRGGARPAPRRGPEGAARRSSWATPTTCICGRANGRGGAGRPAPLHHLGPAHAHRLRRVPGLLARGTAEDQRARGRVPEPHRRRRSGPSPPNARWRSSGPSAPTSPWRSTTWCPVRRTGRWPRRAWSGPCAGWNAAGPDTRRSRPTRRRGRRSGPSSRAAPTPTSGSARSRAPWPAAPGPGSPSAASRWASPSR